MKAELYNATGRDCPRCFRVGTLAGPRMERAQLECTGCNARFQLERGPSGELDTLRRIFFALPDRSVAGLVNWPLVLVLVALLGGCAAGAEPIRGTGKQIEPPSGWAEYCSQAPADPSCKAAP